VTFVPFDSFVEVLTVKQMKF